MMVRVATANPWRNLVLMIFLAIRFYFVLAMESPFDAQSIMFHKYYDVLSLYYKIIKSQDKQRKRPVWVVQKTLIKRCF